MQSLSVEAQAKLEKDTAKKEAKADAKAKAEAEKKQASASSSASLGSFFVRLQTLMEEWRGPCLMHGHVAFAVTSANVAGLSALVCSKVPRCRPRKSL